MNETYISLFLINTASLYIHKLEVNAVILHNIISHACTYYPQYAKLNKKRVAAENAHRTVSLLTRKSYTIHLVQYKSGLQVKKRK